MAAEMNSPMPGNSKNEIAFIDTSVSGYETLLAGIREGVEVVLIDSAHDGLAQIAATLAGRSGVDAVHVFSHGAAGTLQLGTVQLTADNMTAYATELAVVRAAMSGQGELLLYGCDVGQGQAGRAFVEALSVATGADIAASDDSSGSALLGGDWELEVATGTGSVAHVPPLAPLSFSGLLAINSENFDGVGLITDTNTTVSAGNWTFTASAMVDIATATGGEFAVQLNSDGGVNDRAMLMNYTGSFGIQSYTMKSTDGSNFKLLSFQLEQSITANSNLTIRAYSGGLPVLAAEAVNLNASDSTGNISYALADNTISRYGTLTFNAAYANIDEIRFEFAGDSELFIDNINVTTAAPDNTAPVFSSAAVNGATLVMSYTEATGLDAVSPPPASAFAVTAGGSSVTVSGVSVNTGANTVTLTLAAPVGFGQAVTVAYSDPTAGNDVSAIQDLVGNDAASLSATAVTNNTPDTTPPAFASAAVNGNTLVMSYTEATTLNAVNTAGTSAFTVTAGGSGVTVSAVSVDANAKTVTLTLAAPVAHGQAVTVAYADPTGGNDVNAIQDAAGNDAASLSATSVTNNTPDTTGPVVTSVAVPSAASYAAGQTLSFTVNFDENITVAGTDSELALTIGSTARVAQYASKTTTSITYSYTVQAGDNDGNGITVGTLSLGSSTIRDASSNNATLTLNSVGSTSSVLVDTTAPVVSGNISVPSNGSYTVGQTLSFTVTLDEGVTVTGTDSKLGLTIGGTAVNAAYASKTGNSITYAYTVQTGDTDIDGISVGSIALGSSTVLDAAGNAANLTLTGHIPVTTGVLVDTTSPAVSGTISPPSNGTYAIGETLDFTVTFDENITRAGSASTLDLTVGSTARSAVITATTANSITYTYTVQNGDNDSDGIAITGISLNGGTIRDSAGNNASLAVSGHLPTLTGVLVDGGPPSVSGNITVPANDSYHAGEVLRFTVTFDENVTLAGSGSTLGLTIGSTGREAAFESSTANSITYAYTVQAGDTDANGITVGGITLNGHTIKDAVGNDAVLTLTGHLPSTAGVLVDTTAPAVTSVSVPSNATYVAGQNLDFTVTFGENVTVTGDDSTLGLTIGSTARSAVWLSSSGSTVTYRYTVQAGDVDANGITVGSLALNGDTIQDAAGNDAVLTLNSVGATGSVLVDGTVPSVTGTITAPGNDTYMVGETLDFTVTFDENITRAGSASTLDLTVGSTARSAVITATTANSITYTYTVQNGDNDSDGIAITGISLNGGTIRDSAGNNASLAVSGHLPALTGVLVDGGPPSVSGNITVPANDSYHAGEVLRFTVTFDENVTLTGSGSTLGLTIGSTAREAAFESSTANSITYAYTVQAGDTDANGITVGGITLNGHTIKDAVGNDAVLTLTGHLPSTAGVIVDTAAPAVTSVSVPSNATYVAGQNLDFTVTFGENVTVTGDDSTLGLTIGSTARSAVWLSSSGSTVTYRYTVQAGDVDANGITVGSLALNGDTIQDAAGNNAVLTLNSVGATGSVLVDGTVPSVTGTITAPGNDTYVVGETLDFTVTFDENITRAGSASTLDLTVGSTARSAVITATTANSITYTYTVQNGDNDTDGIAITGISLNGGTIRDSAGNNASLAVSGHLPTLTGVLVDTAAPALLTATVNGATMVLTYSDASQLDAVNVPATSAFGVLVAGSPVLVSAVVVNAAAHTVTLTLASAVSNGQAVSVAYADPTGGNDANAIQDAVGNDAASLSSTAVVNNTPSPETPPATGTVDGVPVQTGTVTNPDGSTSQVITVPVVTPSRVEQVGNNTVADIPLVKDAGGTSLLTVQVPVGVGLQASGGAQAKPAGNSLTDLIREIQAHTTAGSQDQNQLTGGGSGFLDALSNDTPLLVQTIVVTGNGGSSSTPLGIIGQPPETSPVQTALVIDARGLPNGATLELQNVEFAAVIGAATVTGGAGSQHVWGDGASQNIFLGADDDVLHGGAGDDIVGSAGGNDEIYGDEGNDLVFGGEGDDRLDGGTGQDIARFSGRSDGYSLRVVDGKLVMAAQAGGDGTDTVAAVETLRFTGGQSSADDAVLARLYEGLLHRSGSAAEVAYWQDVHARGVSMHDVAAAILGSAESGQLGNPGSTSSHGGFVAGLYQNVLGRTASAGESAYWTGLLDSGVDRATVALGFVNSAEKLSSALDVDFNHSDVAVLLRMYHAMFGRAPDEAGLNYWLGVHEQGASLGAIADAFTLSAEAQGLLQQGDNAAFIDQLYQTALDRAPSAAEKVLLLEQLQQGVFDRGQALLNVAESGESIAIVGSVNTSLSVL